jgi:serine/threonine protein kinase
MNTSIKKQCKKLNQLLNINSDCDWSLLNYKEVGRGVKGYTLKACCNGECKYVVKVLPNQKLHLIEREIKMQNNFSELDIAPKILDAFTCDDNVYIVMEALDQTVKDFLLNLQKQKINDKQLTSIIEFLQNQTIELVKRSHHYGLAHLDLHLDNVMIKFDDQGNFNRLYLIDFGKSTQYKTQQEADIEESYDDIKLSFNMYKRRDNRISPQKIYKKNKSPKKYEDEYKTPNKKLSFDDEDDNVSSVARALF